MPGGRPTQPASPSLGSAASPVRVSTTPRHTRTRQGVRLTERAWGVILICIAAVALAGGIVVVSEFLQVSNAPVAGQGTYAQVVAQG